MDAEQDILWLQEMVRDLEKADLSEKQLLELRELIDRLTALVSAKEAA